MRVLKVFLTGVFIFGLYANAALQLKSVPQDGLVEFEAIGRPSMIKIKGQGAGVSSSLEIANNKLNGEIKFNLKSLKTGIDLRDEHMLNKYLQVGQFPEAKLTLSSFPLPQNWSLKNPIVNQAPFKAKLTLHGIEREILGLYSIESADLAAKASFEIKITDYNIELPSYLGVKVTDLVKVKVLLNKITKLN